MAGPFGPIPSSPAPASPDASGAMSSIASLYGGGGTQTDIQTLSASVRRAQLALIELAQSIPALGAWVQKANDELMNEVAKIGSALPEQQGMPNPPTGTSMGPIG